MTLLSLLQQSKAYLKPKSATFSLDAELLLAHVLQQRREYVLTHSDAPISSEHQIHFEALVERRAQGEPMAYLIGYQHFWKMCLKVTPDVLIPRPETEHLIEWILEKWDEKPLTVADLGTGSGAIAIALALERPHWTLLALDQSDKALSVAKQNRDHYSLSNIHLLKSDWCTALPERCDVIVSNPPYIAPHDPHLADLSFEPLTALVSSNEGLADLETIIQTAPLHLKPGGWLVLEHGYHQAAAVRLLLGRAKYDKIMSYQDLQQHERFTVGQFPHEKVSLQTNGR
ncbi:MAG TPA: peptide chain release factor N(5)-glutamine methyltransferase [Coxiellaceae bacterium]|nr:peptide chain release factor N(5)-glutamine methyltransferase [Coxiellaceae bacterium]